VASRHRPGVVSGQPAAATALDTSSRFADASPQLREGRARKDTWGDYESSAAGSNPNTGASDKSLTEPATIDATPTPDPSPDRTSARSRRR
jgi:hypothetical protein